MREPHYHGAIDGSEVVAHQVPGDPLRPGLVFSAEMQDLLLDRHRDIGGRDCIAGFFSGK